VLESLRYLQHNAQLSQKAAQQKHGDIALLCEEWWEITHEDNLNYLDRLFKDEKVRRSVRQSLILELLGVTASYAIMSEKASDPSSFPNGVVNQLKNLFFYVH